jgi:small subunit ribosomal protein S8
MTDPIADMFAQIMNAQKVRAETVDIPHSRNKEAIAKLLVEEGYVEKIDVLKRMDKKFIRLGLKYTPAKQGVIKTLKRISKPGRRIYANARSLPRVQSGFGTALISTSKGVMTDTSARAKKLGGEVVANVW